MNIQNTQIYLNKAGFAVPQRGQGYGGGVYLGAQVTQAVITGANIYSNTADGRGGGIYIVGGSTEESILTFVTLSECSISGNDAQKGGGVGTGLGGALELRLQSNTVISNNRADLKGGGVYLGVGTLIADYGYSITGNTAEAGGGLDLGTGTVWGGDPYGFIWNNLADNVNGGAA